MAIKVLIVCAHRPKRSPSQRYRFEQYLSFLEGHGYIFTYSYLLSELDDVTFYSQGKILRKMFILLKSVLIRFRDILQLSRYDVVLIQRESLFLGSAFFEKKVYRSGAKVIFDFDDSIWLADTSPGNKKWEWIKKPSKFFEAIANAHVVIAGNAYLQAKAKQVNKNVVLIPTTIDTTFHQPLTKTSTETITIGWSGSISTTKHFDTIVNVLVKLKSLYGNKLHFKLVGNKNYSNALLPVEALEWSESTEVEQLNSFDIGIMPLPNDEWANGKCGLKGLSYMACGVPTIMSEVGVNKEIIQHGKNGFLAGNDYEWYHFLRELIENKTLREQFGKEGRTTVERFYSVEANKHKYLEVLHGLFKRQ